MSKKQEQQSQHSPIRLIAEQKTQVVGGQFEEMHWAAAYIDSKFYLAHPLAIDKVNKLEEQIAEQKEKIVNNEQNRPANQASNSIKSYVNHMRPDSALSRQCKTELNQIKVLKAKRDSERKLFEEEEKYKSKLQQVRQNLEHKKQNKSGTQFVIKEHRKSSNKNSHANSIDNRVQKDKSAGISPVAEINRSNKDVSIEEAPLNNFVSFQPIQPPQKASDDKKQSIFAEKSSIRKNNLRYSAKAQKNQSNSKHKSASKSFMINSRKTPSQSKEPRQSSFRKDGQKSGTSMTSKLQLQTLNKKIKEMQQKLQEVQKRQTSLEKLQISRIKNGEEVQKTKKSRIDSIKIQQGDMNSNHNSIIHHDNKDSGQEKIGKGIQTPSSQKDFQQLPKNYSIQRSAKVEDLTQNKINSNNGLNSDDERMSHEDEQKGTIFDLVIKKNKKLNMSSSIYSYNNTEQLQKKKEAEKKLNERQETSQEISNLRKTIRQLKLEKIKHETIIENFEKNNKINQKQAMERHIKQKLKSKESQIKQKIRIPSQSDRQTFKKERQMPPRAQKVEKHPTIQVKSRQPTEQQEIAQIRHNANVKKSPKKIEIPNDKPFNKKIPLTQNPEEQSGRQFHPRSLTKRGIIVRQVINSSADHSQMKITTQSNNDFSRTENQLEPPSPTSTGRKIFQLQFVQIQKEDSVVSQDLEMTVPQIDIEGFPIPLLPNAPSSEITQSQLLKLAKNICQLFEIDVEKDQSLYMKKYKNCIIFKTPDVKKTIVWHYSGKFYVGGWDQNEQGEGKKIGEGYEYVPEKHSYKGQFYNGKKNGSGIMIQENGNIYKGQWENGEKHGQGKYLEKGTGLMYDGEWKNGKKDGKGVQKISEKEFYDGTFVKSIKHGFGSQSFANGDSYHGQYKIGRFHGKGKYIWGNGSSYDGQFCEGYREGYGRWKSCRKGGDKYVGEYKKDKKYGKGKYIWANGCTYDGEFLLDLKHGEGRVNYPDGREAKGYWEHGKLVQIISQTRPDDDQSSHHQNQFSLAIRPNMGPMMETASKELQSSKFVYNM